MPSINIFTCHLIVIISPYFCAIWDGRPCMTIFTWPKLSHLVSYFWKMEYSIHFPLWILIKYDLWNSDLLPAPIKLPCNQFCSGTRQIPKACNTNLLYYITGCSLLEFSNFSFFAILLNVPFIVKFIFGHFYSY